LPNKIKKRHFLDWGILVPYLILTILGLMMVYSTTSYVMIEQGKNPAHQALLQFAFWLVSLLFIFIIYRLKAQVLRSRTLIFPTLAFILALMLLAFFFEPVNNAYGWIQLPGIGTIQPVEFLKFAAIWYFSVTLANRQSTIQSDFIDSIKRMLIIMVIPMVMLFFYPDFGNAAIIFLLVGVMLLASGINYIYTFLTLIFGVAGSVIGVSIVNTVGKLFLPTHVISRFAVFRNPFLYEYDEGHQLVHGYYALFNGGLFGRGLGNSIQKKGFLQFAHTDYAFAIVVEELGLIVAILILGVLFYMVARIFLVGIRSKDPFNSLMCIGIGSLFLISVFVNLGGITGIIPLTGITFPFISQGGSSLLMFSISIGFVLNISADEKKQSLATAVVANREAEK